MNQESNTVLIVDDNESDLELISRYLSCNGYNTHTSDKGTRIIELIICENQSVDIILLGDTIRDCKINEIFKTLRQAYSFSELPVIIFTDKDENEAAEIAIDFGANDFVTKPINYKILKARIDIQAKLKRIQHSCRIAQKNIEHLIEQRADELKQVNSILASVHEIFHYLLNSNLNFANDNAEKISMRTNPELLGDPEYRINRELLARLFTFLQQVNSKNSQLDLKDKSIVKFSGWTLDLNAHELKNYDGETVSLTSYEFQLLSTLVNSPNRVLSRDQIMENITGRERVPTDRSIDVLVGKLRKKIETDPHKPDIIKTIRSTGYKFAARVQYS